ncbi:Hypothetical_protein [Hexamita inflata]|uniref:Hypothetical_protein n=1 Tax=Hexamita inflata TaxID=28002 RepID=A0AA86PFF0_9EUKA|nr:Hypothetical protein HINF_LOCUS25596 [Hexamita inflata]
MSYIMLIEIVESISGKKYQNNPNTFQLEIYSLVISFHISVIKREIVRNIKVNATNEKLQTDIEQNLQYFFNLKKIEEPTTVQIKHNNRLAPATILRKTLQQLVCELTHLMIIITSVETAINESNVKNSILTIFSPFIRFNIIITFNQDYTQKLCCKQISVSDTAFKTCSVCTGTLSQQQQRENKVQKILHINATNETAKIFKLDVIVLFFGFTSAYIKNKITFNTAKITNIIPKANNKSGSQRDFLQHDGKMLQMNLEQSVLRHLSIVIGVKQCYKKNMMVLINLICYQYQIQKLSVYKYKVQNDSLNCNLIISTKAQFNHSIFIFKYKVYM